MAADTLAFQVLVKLWSRLHSIGMHSKWEFAEGHDCPQLYCQVTWELLVVSNSPVKLASLYARPRLFDVLVIFFLVPVEMGAAEVAVEVEINLVSWNTVKRQPAPHISLLLPAHAMLHSDVFADSCGAVEPQ